MEFQMIEILLGSKVKEEILIFLLKNGEYYPTQLAGILNYALISIQKQSDRLEEAGIVISVLKGKTRVYSFNPRYFFLNELMALMEKVYRVLPKEDKEKYIIRKRPRRRRKPL